MTNRLFSQYQLFGAAGFSSVSASNGLFLSTVEAAGRLFTSDGSFQVERGAIYTGKVSMSREAVEVSSI
ncbi:MAG: hypothetical protein WBJ10_10205 [Daejeonella sp.]|uniref:hypothetical protein n=1 Tax=Daejeonella sp. TaxID=2805397 RepID=UPI003C74364A